MRKVKTIVAVMMMLSVIGVATPQVLAGDVQTPTRTGEVHTPGKAGDAHTPGKAGEISTPGFSAWARTLVLLMFGNGWSV